MTRIKYIINVYLHQSRLTDPSMLHYVADELIARENGYFVVHPSDSIPQYISDKEVLRIEQNMRSDL